MIRLAPCAAVLAVFAAAPAAADTNTNTDVNAIYERMAEGIRTHDPEMSRKTYTADAAYLPPNPGPIDQGERLHALMRGSGERLKADQVAMTISYRVVRRTLAGNTAIDMGYYRTTMKRGTDGAEQVRYNKFLLTARREPDGTWRISHDASLPSSKEAYEAATPVAGLKFDG